MNLTNLFFNLFNPDDCVNIRILHEQKKTGKDYFFTDYKIAHALDFDGVIYKEKNLFPCVAVNPRNAKTKKVSVYKNIVVDIDNAPLPAWAHNRADIICSRDDRHHHLYFCFEPLTPNDKNRKLYSDTVKALLKLTGSKEKAAHDPERVIRLPGFSHGKTGKPGAGYEIKFMRDDIQRLPFKEKFDWIKTKKENEQIRQSTVNAITESPTPTEKTHVNSIQYLKNLYIKKPALAAGDGRSRELFFVGLDAHAWGIPQNEAEQLAEEINQKKFDPPEDNDVVLHQINSAYRYRKGEFGSLLNNAKGQTDRQQVRARLQFETIQRARDLLASFVYVHGAERLIDTATRFELTTMTQINNYITAKLGEKVTLEELLKASALTCADELDYVPGEPDLFERDGRTIFNKYTNGVNPQRDKGQAKKAVKIFREHVAYLTTSEAEETTLLQFLAFAIQNPGKKLKWAPLIISRFTGTGRGALAELIEGIAGRRNVGTANSNDLTGTHTDYVAEKVFVVVHEVETEDKNVMRSLKSLITEAPLRVVAKYARTYTTTNKANFLFFSNRVDAIRIDDNDRRLLVIYNRRDPKPQAYYDTLYKTFTEGAGFILDYLLAVDLSGFNPHARPVQTEGRDMLTRTSESELSAYLKEIFRAGDGPFAKPFFTTRDVINHVAFSGPDSARRYASQRAVSYWLDGKGFHNYDYYLTVDGASKHLSVWFLGTREDFERVRRKIKNEVT